MSHYRMPLFLSVVLLAGPTATGAKAQSAQAHVAAARTAASEPGLHDFTGTFTAVCAEREPGTQGLGTPGEPDNFNDRPIPERSEWYVEPVKIFDNLYNVGTSFHVWAVTTSEGIVLLNSGKDYSMEGVVEGLETLGLDPANVRYVVILAPHDLHYGAAKLFQDRYGSRILLSEADWNIIEETEYVPAALKPRKDMVVTDGQQLTLGDTTLTLQVTPGHGPGSLSILVPLKDGNQRHLGALVGGRDWNFLEEGLFYFSSEEEAIEAWKTSTARFRDITGRAGADVLLATRSHHDQSELKNRTLSARQAGEPHPYVDRNAVGRYLTVISDCMDAQLARRAGQ
jgi:metallo-beta-lactamase class B